MRALALAMLLAACRHGDPARTYTRADLASSDQATRDGAAAQLRASWTPPPRDRWDALVAALDNGDPLASLTSRLPEANDTLGGGCGGGGCTQTWQVDDAWTITCGYRDQAATLMSCKVGAGIRRVWVDPPAKLTGVWTTYFANGQRAHEIHYRDGAYHGTFTRFTADGAVLDVQTYPK